MQHDKKQKNRVIFSSATYVLRRRSIRSSIQRGHQGAELDYPSHKVIKSKKNISAIKVVSKIPYFILTSESVLNPLTR